ncbi:MAG TPA: BTAD domain-containing putative transcriptional regulator [Gaiellaceae bacterium]|nr:BTAD domain-containing putative transcriptional regulator [Gaiellaceae bacterium]
MPEFRLLGPLEVMDDDGEPIPLGGTKQRAALAVLLLRAGEVVSTGFLVDALWGEAAPRTATTSLQNLVSALRKLLGPELLVTRPPGYVLMVDKERVDLYRFERLVREAAAQAPEERVRLLREALDLWRGDPLAELAFEPFAAPEVFRLEELRLSATEDLLGAQLDAGQAAELVPELESLVARHPLRERLRGQLMLALYRAGRQADALAAYQNARQALVAELGLEPGPQLQQLHAAILRQEARLHPAAAAASPEEHVEQVAAALLAGRLVAVLGTNVSELAARLADRFEYPPDEASDLTRVAQYVALTNGSGPLYDELHAMLSTGAAPTPVHRFFAALPPLLRDRGVPHMLLVTTSYDLALEQALLEAGEEFDVVSYVAAGRSRGRFCHLQPDGTACIVDLPNTYATELSLERRTIVLKLHGGVDPTPTRELESFVVTEDDYIDYLAYGDIGGAVPVALAAKLRRSHFLFLGYGMRDWNLRLVLGRIWGSEGVSYRSWAVQPEAKPLERQFWRVRDVDLLEVPLDEYVAALARFVGLSVEAAA